MALSLSYSIILNFSKGLVRGGLAISGGPGDSAISGPRSLCQPLPFGNPPK